MRLAKEEREPEMRAHSPDQRGAERHGRGGKGRDGHAPSRPGRGKIGLGCLDQGQDALGMISEPPSRVGQLGRAGGPVQQHRPGLPLQCGKLLRHC